MRFEYYESGGMWFWRLRASNGKIVADGGESYFNEASVLRALRRLRYRLLLPPPIKRV